MAENFIIQKLSANSIENELETIGFDKSYIKVAKKKYKRNLYKIYALTSIQATILKQTALSVGTDCAVHREVLTHKIDKSDAILSANPFQLKKIVKKLLKQPFGLKTLATNLNDVGEFSPESFEIRGKVFDFKKTYLMGILNITPNSFSDGGEFAEENSAVARFNELVIQGANIIDIGAESTAPNSTPISTEEEISRLKRVLEKCRQTHPNAIISIDTRNSKTAKLALELGADIINDVSGLSYDEKMGEVVAENEGFVILTFDGEINSKNTIDEVINGLLARVEKALQTGIKKEKIILDVGLGFNKTFEQNFELIKSANEICALGFPVLYGLSRKSFIQKITGKSAKETLCANISLASYLAEKGVNILRVHEVAEHKTAFCALNEVLND